MLPNDAPVPVPVRAARGLVRRTFGSLDTHNYRLYFAGHLVSHTGSWMQNMAEAWLVLKLTGSGASVGTAWVFFVNAVSFFAVVSALAAMRPAELRRWHRASERPRVREGLAYAWGIPEIRGTILLVAVVGTLVYNFPTFLTLLAHDTFHGGAGLAGLLMAVLGLGTVAGGLSAALRARPTSRIVVLSAALLGLALIAAA